MKRAWRGTAGVALLAMGLAASLAGCRTPLVDAAIVNQGPALRLIEFDYPYASFGADALAAGGQLHHRFSVKGAGTVTLHFVDAAGKDHTAQGPKVNDGENGTLVVVIDSAGTVHWSLKPTALK